MEKEKFISSVQQICACNLSAYRSFSQLVNGLYGTDIQQIMFQWCSVIDETLDTELAAHNVDIIS